MNKRKRKKLNALGINQAAYAKARLEGCTQKEAAIRAGYSKSTAEKSSKEIEQSETVQAIYDEAMKFAVDECKITAAGVAKVCSEIIIQGVYKGIPIFHNKEEIGHKIDPAPVVSTALEILAKYTKIIDNNQKIELSTTENSGFGLIFNNDIKVRYVEVEDKETGKTYIEKINAEEPNLSADRQEDKTE